MFENDSTLLNHVTVINLNVTERLMFTGRLLKGQLLAPQCSPHFVQIVLEPGIIDLNFFF